MNMFGFTNDTADYERVVRFREAAIADGWTHEPTYNCEPEERASKHYRDGFTMSFLCRSRENEVLNPKAGIHQTMHHKWRYVASVSIWGPDGLAIAPPPEYDWQKIQAYLRHCGSCGADDVDTKRYSFAGRCCAACLPEMQRRHEYPGWTA